MTDLLLSLYKFEKKALILIKRGFIFLEEKLFSANTVLSKAEPCGVSEVVKCVLMS
jgi:hypothetical protein